MAAGVNDSPNNTIPLPLLRHGPTLLASNLRYNFLLHLLNLWDNALLAAGHITYCKLLRISLEYWANIYSLKAA